MTSKRYNANQKKKKSPRDSIRVKDPFIHASDKNIKLRAIIYTQRTRPCAGCFSLWDLTWPLLSWFRTPCSPGVVHLLWLFAFSGCLLGQPRPLLHREILSQTPTKCPFLMAVSLLNFPPTQFFLFHPFWSSLSHSSHSHSSLLP